MKVLEKDKTILNRSYSAKYSNKVYAVKTKRIGLMHLKYAQKDVL